MNVHEKISALITTATLALSLTACSTQLLNKTGGTPNGDNPTGDGSSAYPASVANLMSKYENDLLNDVKKNGLTAINTSTAVTGWDPREIENGTPETGGDAVLSSASLDGIDVSLIAHNISRLPTDGIDGGHLEDCGGKLCADRVLLYLKDDEGRKVLSTQINSISPGHHRISGECLFDGSTRIYKTAQDGKDYYLLMQYAEYDEDKDALIATFYVLDMEFYDILSAKDENGVSSDGLWIIDINAPAESRISSWGQAYQASKRFEYKSGTTFYDPEYGYQITFDMKRGKATVAYPNE